MNSGKHEIVLAISTATEEGEDTPSSVDTTGSPTSVMRTVDDSSVSANAQPLVLLLAGLPSLQLSTKYNGGAEESYTEPDSNNHLTSDHPLSNNRSADVVLFSSATPVALTPANIALPRPQNPHPSLPSNLRARSTMTKRERRAENKKRERKKKEENGKQGKTIPDAGPLCLSSSLIDTQPSDPRNSGDWFGHTVG